VPVSGVRPRSIVRGRGRRALDTSASMTMRASRHTSGWLALRTKGSGAPESSETPAYSAGRRPHLK
jgi:hypothetical protein